jgi:hypothetical protein
VIAVVCTDRGRHPEKQLAWLFVERIVSGERVFVLVPWARFDRLHARDADREAQTQRGGTLRVPKCPVRTCRYDVPMSQTTAARVYDAASAVGERVDISRW